MQIHTRLGSWLAALAAVGLVLAACSSSSPEPAAVSLEEYFQRIQALHDTQESQSEVIAQRFADQLSGDEAGLEEVLAAVESVLPEFLPEFRAVLSQTKDGLAEITAPATAQDAHADLIAAYDELVALFDHGLDQLADGQSPTKVLSAVFSDRSGSELAQRFSAIADQLASVADRAGLEGFVGGGPLVPSSTGEEDTVIADRNAGTEPADPLLPPNRPTGIAEADRVIDGVLGFAIYLAPEHLPTNRELDLSDIKLSDEPLISVADIASYDAATHEIRLMESVAERLERFDLPGKPFIVAVDRQPIYQGTFMAAWFSRTDDGVVILWPPLGGGLARGLLRIQLGYPGPDFFSGNDPRADARIMRTLERDEKLADEGTSLIPSSEPADPLRPPGSPTGIGAVDRVIDAVLGFSGDFTDLDALIRYTATECTLELGGGGPPKCWSVPGVEQVEDAPVVVFPFSVCETEWEPQAPSLARVLGMLVDPTGTIEKGDDVTTIEVYGIYTVSAVAEPSDWPAGDYAVVFATEAGDALWGTTVRIAGGGVVSIEFGCGRFVPAVMAAAFADHLLEPPLGGLALAGDAVIATVEHLPLHAIEETTPQWRLVIDLVVPVGGFRSVLIDNNTVLQRTDDSPATVADLAPGKSVAVSGVPLPWSLWRAERILIGD